MHDRTSDASRAGGIVSTWPLSELSEHPSGLDLMSHPEIPLRGRNLSNVWVTNQPIIRVEPARFAPASDWPGGDAMTRRRSSPNLVLTRRQQGGLGQGQHGISRKGAGVLQLSAVAAELIAVLVADEGAQLITFLEEQSMKAVMQPLRGRRSIPSWNPILAEPFEVKAGKLRIPDRAGPLLIGILIP